MTDKTIGIFGWKVTENNFGVSIPYLSFAELFGEVKIIGLGDAIDTSLDLLIVPGGPDVNPLRYHAIPDYYTSRPDPIKEYQDTVLLPQYIAAGVPVFGICRGMQTLAVLYGASLIQNMYHETNDTDRGKTVHEIGLEPNFINKIEDCNGRVFKVNSMHHQCISQINFPTTLEIVAKYYNNKKNYFASIEVIKHKSLPIWGVQYHPEELGFDNLSYNIIKNILRSRERVSHFVEHKELKVK